MKRSEMKKMITILLERQAHQGTSYSFKAQIILEKIEKLGMLPPDSPDYIINSWEPEYENEKK